MLQNLSSMNNHKLMQLKRSLRNVTVEPESTGVHCTLTVILLFRPPETDYLESCHGNPSNVKSSFFFFFSIKLIWCLIYVTENYDSFYGFATTIQNSWSKNMLWQWLQNEEWTEAKVWWHFAILDVSVFLNIDIEMSHIYLKKIKRRIMGNILLTNDWNSCLNTKLIFIFQDRVSPWCLGWSGVVQS